MHREDRIHRRLAAVSRHLSSASPSIETSSNFRFQDVCGIVGYVGKEPALPYLIDGLRILQNRGYDSAGITTLSKPDILLTTKYASVGSTSDAIERLAKETAPHAEHTCGIAHTRWATHGAKTDSNAHPHVDMRARIAVAHNGVIENSQSLKEELQKNGVQFSSETDTEVIAQLIGQYVHEGLPTNEAVSKALSRLEGTWGLVIVDKNHPDQIIAAKNGSPLLIGISPNRTFVASEPSAFSQHTKEFIALENGEIAVINSQGHSLDQTRVELASHETVTVSPEPYPHWTIREIFDQPAAVSRAMNYGGRILDASSVKLGGLEEKGTLLRQIKHLIIAACGTSYHAGLYGAQLMRWFGSFETIQVFDAAELTRDCFPREATGFLAISQSGETKDVTRALAIAEELGLTCFSVVNAVRSLIARQTVCGVYLNAGREVAVASTKAFTCQVTVLSLIAIWFCQQHGINEKHRIDLIEALHRLPTNIGMTLNNLGTQCKTIATKLLKAQSLFILGKGFAEPIAREGSLKIKEIGYLHAEGYPGGALKHGPFALIDTGVPIILIILSDQHASLMKTAAAEVKTRGAHTIVITDLKHHDFSQLADDVIYVPSNGPLTALLTVIPLQLIAYELSILKGINPDKPRHLAKAVTVD